MQDRKNDKFPRLFLSVNVFLMQATVHVGASLQSRPTRQGSSRLAAVLQPTPKGHHVTSHDTQQTHSINASLAPSNNSRLDDGTIVVSSSGP